MKRHKETQKLSKKLLPEERKQYKIFGEPDMTQDWLELFTPTLVSDLFTIKNFNSDNQEKADYVEKELAPYGFEVRGEGTNVLTMSNPVYPGVVFKIALDDCGIADNFNDDILQHYIPRYNKVLARHSSAIVSVQVRAPIIKDSTRMGMFKADILKLLKQLSKDYLVADLSPSRHLNYGVGRDGDFIIIDGSDLFPLSRIKDSIRCKQIVGQRKKTDELKRCGGRLHYTTDFMYLVCEDCGKSYLPLEFKPKKEISKMRTIISNGLSREEQRQLEREEIEAICRKQGICVEPRAEDENDGRIPSTPMQQRVYVDMDTDDEQDDKVVRTGKVAQAPRGDDQAEESQEDPTDDEDSDEEEFDTLHRAAPAQDSPKASISAAQDRKDTTESEGSGLPTPDPAAISDVMLGDARFQNMLSELNGTAQRHPEVFKAFVVGVLGVAREANLVPDELQIKLSNTNISDEPEREPGKSYITYRVVNELGQDSLSPGIYLEIHGDPEEAYENSGLPIYATVPDIDAGTQSMIVGASSMQKIIVPIVKDFIDELLDIQRETGKRHDSDNEGSEDE